MLNRLMIMSLLLAAASLRADPPSDLKAFRAFFEQRFANIEIDDHRDGAYALDAAKREQWLSIEDFPPYEIAIEAGEALFAESFADGLGYADCFENGGRGVKQTFPRFDVGANTVQTLELAINECRKAHGEAPLDYASETMGALTAYMAYTSRGETFAITVPPEGLAAYNEGKAFFYARRGQLNFSCAGCHVASAGGMLRAEILSASVGHATHWPTYRLKWEQVGSLHKRFNECNEQVGAEGLPEQSASYRNLEYFLSYMNNGMTLNGPASRK